MTSGFSGNYLNLSIAIRPLSAVPTTLNPRASSSTLIISNM